jgi:hypothetical protein
MKTAMQELKYNSLFTEGEEYIQIVLKKTEWVELLEKEKEQIIDAFENGEYNIDSDGCHIDINGAEQYYNETYNQDRITISETKRSIEGIGLNNQNQ